MLSLFIFSQMAAHADAIFVNPTHNEADSTPSRTHVPSKDMNATSALQIAAQQGLGEYGLDVERTKHALKDAIRLRAMHRLQNRLQKAEKEEAQDAASADAEVTGSLAISKQKNLESSLMDKGKKDSSRRRRTGCAVGKYGTLITTISNSALCRPEYPNLELWAGNEGDRCRTGVIPAKKLCPNEARIGKGAPARTWSCPEGCVYSGETEPYCLNVGTRNLCTVSAAIRSKCGSGPCLKVCRYPHQKLVHNSRKYPNVNKGDYCSGKAQNWFPSKGCDATPLSISNPTSPRRRRSGRRRWSARRRSSRRRWKLLLQTGEGEGQKHALKDALRLRAMHRLQDRLQKTETEEVQGAASADAGVTDSLASSKQKHLESSLMDKGSRRRRSWSSRRRNPRRRAPVPRRRRAAPGAAAPVGLPFTWVKGKRGWATGKVCHTDSADVLTQLAPDASQDNTIRGFWRMVASSTHGASVKLQTGFSSSNSDSTTKSEEKSFSADVSITASSKVGANPPVGPGASTTKSVGLSVSAGGSSSIASTIGATMGQSKAETITVQCPDESMSTMVMQGTSSSNTKLTSHSSLALEYVYQWVVGNANYEAKTQHFRCHRVADGTQHPPQCAPQFCGNPFQNPYCYRSGAGADVRCNSR